MELWNKNWSKILFFVILVLSFFDIMEVEYFAPILCVCFISRRKTKCCGAMFLWTHVMNFDPVLELLEVILVISVRASRPSGGKLKVFIGSLVYTDSML